MRGVLLAAGLGTRLFPLTQRRAKAAIPFLNRPLIEYSLEMLRRAGVQEVAVNLHHLPETVKAALSADDATLHYSFEEQILGTAGAVGKLRRFLEGAPFVVCNAKIYFEQDLSEVLELHRFSDALATLVVAPPAPDSPFNQIGRASCRERV